MTVKTKKVLTILSLIILLSIVFLISLAYIYYRDLKKAFVAQLSTQATSFIGQEVSIGDLSFSPAGAINLHTITLHNPKDFTAGNLLTIKKLSLKMHYREIVKKQLLFEKIIVHEPKLTVIRNKDGKYNISDTLREFFARKPTFQYRIDDFTIKSGIVDFNGDQKFRTDDLNVSIRNLSSERDTKTSIRGHTTYAGSRVTIDGWGYLKDDPKRLNISIASQDISLAPLKGFLNKYGVEITKTKATLYLNAEGDTAKGFQFSSEIGMKDAKFAFLKKGVKEILLRIHAFFRIPDNTVLIDKTSLNAGGVTAITVKGELKKVKEDFSYAAWAKIKMLDLSSMNFMKDVKISGMVNSDNLHVRGSMKKKKLLTELSGSIQLRDAKIQTPDFGIGQINADMKFLSAKEAVLDFTIKELKYGGHTMPWVHVKSGMARRDMVINLKSTAIKSQDFIVSSQRASIRLPVEKKKNGVRVEIRGMHASYPERKAGVRNAALSMTVNKVRNVFSGEVDFSADEIMYRDAHTGFIKGSGRINNKNFSVDIPQADISGGRISLTAAGRTSRDTFPVTIKVSADNINLGDLSRDISKIVNISYPLSGNVTRAVFEGTVHSVASIQGKAAIEAEKITIPDKKKKRTIMKDGMVKAEIEFRGKDLDVRADAGAGKISVAIAGTVTGFGQKNRLAELRVGMPQSEMADIRDAFWDVFPDSLLYAGMEGSLSSDIAVRYDDSALEMKGKLLLNDLVLKGENGEYSFGPVKGELPVVYAKRNGQQYPPELPSFERNEFQKLSAYYARKTVDERYNLISVGNVNYGFQLLDDVKIWIRSEKGFLHVGHFSGNIFGGKLNGSAVINLSDVIQYRAGFLVEGLSLTQLCDRIEPIRGYISGKVDGIATVKGESAGIPGLIGKADFWTYSSEKEQTKISKEFLHKVGGPSLKRYLGERKFDKGTMSVYLQKGFVIFRELEISNRNFFGMKDLDIKVAPLSNRISLDHLLWSITEAAYRAKKKE